METLNDIQTKEIFNLFFGLGIASGMTITDADKQKATFLLNELIEKSQQMSYIEGLFSFEGTFNSLILNAISVIRKHKDIRNGKYYEMVKITIARNFRSDFSIRKITGEW